MKPLTFKQIYNLSTNYVKSLLEINNTNFQNEVFQDEKYIKNRYNATIIFYKMGRLLFAVEDDEKDIKTVYDVKEDLLYTDPSVVLTKYFKEIYINYLSDYQSDFGTIDEVFDKIILKIEEDSFNKLKEVFDEDSEEYYEDPEDIELQNYFDEYNESLQYKEEYTDTGYRIYDVHKNGKKVYLGFVPQKK